MANDNHVENIEGVEVKVEEVKVEEVKVNSASDIPIQDIGRVEANERIVFEGVKKIFRETSKKAEVCGNFHEEFPTTPIPLAATFETATETGHVLMAAVDMSGIVLMISFNNGYKPMGVCTYNEFIQQLEDAHDSPCPEPAAYGNEGDHEGEDGPTYFVLDGYRFDYKDGRITSITVVDEANEANEEANEEANDDVEVIMDPDEE